MALFFYVCASILITYVQALEGESLNGGVETLPGEITYQVAIYKNKFICGGAIIDEQFILTAGHCVINIKDKFDTKPITVFAGIDNYNNRDNVLAAVQVVKAYTPAIFNNTDVYADGDIAVLKLKEKLDLSPNSGITKVDLPPKAVYIPNTPETYENETALVTGFGWDKVKIEYIYENSNFVAKENGSSSGKLLKAKVLILNGSVCRSAYTLVTDELEMCARIIENPPDVPQGICSGDSGSPLVKDNTIIGVVNSSKKGCNENKYPAVYARVTAFIDFINNAMNDVVTEDIRSFSW